MNYKNKYAIGIKPIILEYWHRSKRSKSSPIYVNELLSIEIEHNVILKNMRTVYLLFLYFCIDLLIKYMGLIG